MATIPSGFPDASSTGVPDGTQLTVYTGPMTITKAGTVIDGKIINGMLTILADNVVIKNSLIQYNDVWGINSNSERTLTVLNSTFIGPGAKGEPNAAILGRGTFQGLDISGSENGIVLKGGSSVVKDNYIHDLQGAPGGHVDGISVQGDQNGVLIEHNTILSWHTSDIIIKTDFGPINDITVKNNLLINQSSSKETGYPVYSIPGNAGGNPTNVSIIDNVIQKGYPGAFYNLQGNVKVSGNIDYDAAKYIDGALKGTAASLILDHDSPPVVTPPVVTPPVVTPPVVTPPVVVQPTKPTVPTQPSTPSTPEKPQSSGDHSGTKFHDKLAEVFGTKGADVLTGGKANNTYYVNHLGDKIVDLYRGGVDTVKSTVSFDLGGSNVKGLLENLQLLGTGAINGRGNFLSNKITGNDADNILAGGRGNDILTGRGGHDTFVFDSLPNSRFNKDTITDFDAKLDSIALDHAIFSKLGGLGTLSADAFEVGTSAHRDKATIVYNDKTGALSYDDNGSNAGSSVQFASLSPHLQLTHDHFQII